MYLFKDTGDTLIDTSLIFSIKHSCHVHLEKRSFIVMSIVQLQKKKKIVLRCSLIVLQPSSFL